MSKKHSVLVAGKGHEKPKLPIKTIFFDHHPYERTEVIEEWLDTEKEVIEMNGSYEKLTIVCSETTETILDSITNDDFIKWKAKRGYNHTCLDKNFKKLKKLQQGGS